MLAFDPGRTKTGVAVGNALTGAARPLETVRGPLDRQLERACELCADWQPQLLLVGRPGPAAKAADRYCERFAARLQERTGIACAFADEYLTSQLADASAAVKAGTDAAAACLLATDWLAANAP